MQSSRRRESRKKKLVRKNVEENSAEYKNVKRICFSTCLSFRLYSVGCPLTDFGGESLEPCYVTVSGTFSP